MARFKRVEREEDVEDTPGMRIAAQQPANQILTPRLYAIATDMPSTDGMVRASQRNGLTA